MFFLMFSGSATVLLVFSLVIIVAYGAILPPDEVNGLREIAMTISKEDWNFSVDPCATENGWIQKQNTDFENAVYCDCSYDANTTCHVVSIVQKSQNLAGTVPPNLVILPYLQEIDFSRNYLNGTIPPEWGSMPLVRISLLGNRVTGSIPKELANISTLVSLVLEFNQLSGTIPPEFGSFPGIQRFFLTSNNLTGELPETLANLRTLEDFRIGDNQFTGSIPNYIENWTKITALVIQGSGLSGPIPAGISLLTNLTDLRISDLKGNESTFPFLGNATGMETLILRSCNIVGQIPDYLANMTALKRVLDLSFNKLTGNISVDLSKIRKLYLTGNMLTGPLPSWTNQIDNTRNIDVSYNNLSTQDLSCTSLRLNLFASSKGNTSGIDSCVRNLGCPQTLSGFRINCGGRRTTFENKAYDEDTGDGGPSSFSGTGSANWRVSSTGHFLDRSGDSSKLDNYTTTNNSKILSENPELYMNARLSPLSLTYYGFCLQNGNYKVDLHFAEIMFTDDRTYFSLGRRVFDVYIQGKLVQKDFNIEEKAGGVNKAIIMSYTAEVADNSLDIRFYWAGKGTTALPVKSVYGPLVSAISVERISEGNSISAGTVVGIVIGVVLGISLVLGAIWWRYCGPRKNSRENDLKDLDLHTGSFSLRQIKAATNNFDSANKIGEGGFGSVYKGVLSDGTFIAVKQLSAKSKQGNREFVNEIGMISALQHPNLVKLYGCCIEGNQLLLVYEYMENNSLARALFGPEEFHIKLDWQTRHKICVGIARGLAYLHEESRLKIVHRDIKGTNVLLDKNLNPKISDFGLAKLDEEDNTHISTRIAGTYGYMAPEYAMRGYLTDKADVYSFGIVALEIVSGRVNTSSKPREDSFYLLDWALVLKEKGNLMELVDPRFENDFNKEEVLTTINLALLCTNVSPAVRPSMSSVVSMLEGREVVQVFDSAREIVQMFDSDSSESSSQSILKEKAKNNEYSYVTSTSDSQVQSSMSMEMPHTESSGTSNDLYPIKLDSSYWEKRG